MMRLNSVHPLSAYIHASNLFHELLRFLSGYETQIDVLNREKTNIKRDFEVKVESMRTDKESLSNSLLETRDAKRQTDMLQREVSEKNTVIERLQVIRNTLENERNTFKKEANNLRSQLNTLKDQERVNRDEIQVCQLSARQWLLP